MGRLNPREKFCAVSQSCNPGFTIWDVLVCGWGVSDLRCWGPCGRGLMGSARPVLVAWLATVVLRGVTMGR